MPAKIGSASHLFVTTLSILSEIVSSFEPAFFFTTAFAVNSLIYVYLWFVIMDSASSSISFSQSSMCCSRCFFRSSLKYTFSRAFSSLSKTLMAYQRRFSGGTIFSIDSSICAIACSTEPVNTCGRSCAFFSLASFRHSSTASMQPSE